MQLRVTDGTTTVTLSGQTGIAGCTYFPATASAGGAQVSETAEIVGSGTAAQIRSAANSIEKLLDDARRRRASGLGTRVFVEYKPVDSDTLYRSEILDGRVVWSAEPAYRRLGDSTPAIRYAVILERAPWWEGPETELAISANGQSAATGGRTLTNDGVNNWVQVADTQVGGTLPAPVRLRLINNTGSGQGYARLHVGINALAAPTTFGHVIQGESQVSGYGSDQANGSSSGGYYARFSVGAAGAIICHWVVPAAMMAAGGRWLQLLMALAGDAPTGTTVKWSIYDFAGLVLLWEGQEVALAAGTRLHDTGAVPIPPGSWGTNYGQVRLVLWAKRPAGTANLDIDYIGLVGPDGYRYVYELGYSVLNNEYLEFDEIEGRAYVADATYTYPILVTYGSPLMIYPGRTQRVWVWEMLSNGTTPITLTHSVRMWYRPRRATV